jgi:hypothetical protein
MDPEMERDLNELRDLASTKIFSPNLTDILRAVIKAGVPIVRAELLGSSRPPPQPPPADAVPDALARSTPAARKKRKS